MYNFILDILTSSYTVLQAYSPTGFIVQGDLINMRTNSRSNTAVIAKK